MSQPPYGTQPPPGGQPPYGAQPPGPGQPPGAGQPGYGGPPNSGGSGWGQPTTPVPPPQPTSPAPPAAPLPPAQPVFGPPTPGQPVYGQPTPQYGQSAPQAFGGSGAVPPYGAAPGVPYGAPSPNKTSPLPFIILGLVVLLVAGGVGLFFVLKKDDPTVVATTTTASTTTTTLPPTDTQTEDTGSSTDTGSPGGGDPNFPESEVLAVTFIQLMSASQYDSAYALLCQDGKDRFANGQALADDFFGFIEATAVTGSQTTDVHADPDDSNRDIVEFDLTTDVGNVPLAVSMFEENGTVTICGYDTP